MRQDWELEEKDEHIAQGVLLLSKLLINPNNCELRAVCENYIKEHKAYVPDEPKGYDISQLDGNPDNLNF